MNTLEYLGVLFIVVIAAIAIVCLFGLISMAISDWKLLHQNKCPFCGAYLHGFKNKFKGAKYDPRYCSRCGKSLQAWEDDSNA